MIRAPESVSDSHAWLEKFAPKNVAAINDKPALPFARSLGSTLDLADKLGVDDVGEIVGTAIKFTKDRS